MKRYIHPEENRMSDPTFITMMQRFMVNASVTVSAVRQGPKAVPGVKKAASDFLCDIDVTEFADPKIFPAVLDKATENLTKAFPPGAGY
jgi:hypothetical protein